MSVLVSVDSTVGCVPLRGIALRETHGNRIKTGDSRLAANPTDWVFASAKTHGRTPRVGNMLVADHLRPAAIKAGVVLKPGQRFGFHNLRHSLSSLLITGQKSDVRTTQDILRHSSSATTLDLYTQSPMAQRIAAQESVLSAILKQPTGRRRPRSLRSVTRARLRTLG